MASPTDEPLDVLYVTPQSGVASGASELLRLVPGIGSAVRAVWWTDQDGAWARELRRLGQTTLVRPISQLQSWGLGSAVIPGWLERPPQVVHAVGASAAALGWRCFESVPVVWHLEDVRRSIRAGWVARRAAAVLASAPRCVARQGLSEHSRVSILPEPVHQAAVEPRPFGSGVAVVGMIADRGAECGESEFLQVARWFRKRNLPGTFVLRSDRRASTRADEVRCSNPMQGDLWSFLESLDLLVVPSRRSLRSDLLLQAMAFGLPVITTSVPGASDLVTSGENGWLIVPGDARGLFRACRFLVSNRQLASEMGERARRRIVSDHLAEDVALRLIELYRGVACPEHASPSLAQLQGAVS